jgi:hypothetical protein
MARKTQTPTASKRSFAAAPLPRENAADLLAGSLAIPRVVDFLDLRLINLPLRLQEQLQIGQ